MNSVVGLARVFRLTESLEVTPTRYLEEDDETSPQFMNFRYGLSTHLQSIPSRIHAFRMIVSIFFHWGPALSVDMYLSVLVIVPCSCVIFCMRLAVLCLVQFASGFRPALNMDEVKEAMQARARKRGLEVPSSVEVLRKPAEAPTVEIPTNMKERMKLMEGRLNGIFGGSPPPMRVAPRIDFRPIEPVENAIESSILAPQVIRPPIGSPRPDFASLLKGREKLNEETKVTVEAPPPKEGLSNRSPPQSVPRPDFLSVMKGNALFAKMQKDLNEEKTPLSPPVVTSPEPVFKKIPRAAFTPFKASGNLQMDLLAEMAARRAVKDAARAAAAAG